MKRILKIFPLFIIIILSLQCKKDDDINQNNSNEDICWIIKDWNGLMDDSTMTTNELQGIPAIDNNYNFWLNQDHNKIDIRSLTSENFSDLQCLKNCIQNRTIVQLGESSHGTKQYSQIKVRLIKFLHEQMGFDVIAFESGLFECFYTNENIQGFTEIEAMKNSIFYQGLWGTPDVKELFTYIKETQSTSHPLILAGFDCQFTSNNSSIYKHPSFLYDLLAKVDSDYATEQRIFDSIVINRMSAWNTVYLLSYKDSIFSHYNHIKGFIDIHSSELISAYPLNPVYPEFIKQTINSLIAQINHILIPPDGGLSGNPDSYIIRDSAMAANVVFLKDKLYPQKKIILWAHNYHIANAAFKHALYPDIKNMGIYLKEKYNNDLYTIGLYSLRGKTKTDWDWTVINIPPPTSANSLESILYYCRKKSMFVDFLNQVYCEGNKWMFTPISAKTSGFADETMIIKNVYDGVMFIDSSSVPTYLP